MLSIEEKEKYNRQLILPGYKEEHQQKLKNSKILVIGAGGLGSVVLTYLSRTGVGTIGIVEFDKVDITNLHRQTLYTENDIDAPKINIAIEKIREGNNSVKCIMHKEKLTSENAKNILKLYDVIADCTDNFSTRYLINDISDKLNKPVVFASVANFEGQVTILNHKQKVNYRDIFPEEPKQEPVKGIIPSLLPIIGGIQTNEAIKIITGLGKTLDGKILIYDAFENKQNIIQIS